MLTVTVGSDVIDVPYLDLSGIVPPASLTVAGLAEYNRRAHLDPYDPAQAPLLQNRGLLDASVPLTVYSNLVTVHDGDVYVNADFKAGVRIAGKGKLWNFKASIVAPDVVIRGTSSGNVSGLYGSELVGFVIDAQATSEYHSAIDGGNSIQLFGEYKNAVDGIDLTSSNGGQTLIVFPYIHDLRVLPAPNTHPSDTPPLTHDDGVQLQRGQNIRILGPFAENIPMQAILLKQEVSNATPGLLGNIEIANLRVGAGVKTGVNISVAFGNQLSTVTILNPIISRLCQIGIIANIAGSVVANRFLGKIINPRWDDGAVLVVAEGK